MHNPKLPNICMVLLPTVQAQAGQIGLEAHTNTTYAVALKGNIPLSHLSNLVKARRKTNTNRQQAKAE